jgi:hypothetical protein
MTALRAQIGHRRTAVNLPKADKASRGLVGRDGWTGHSIVGFGVADLGHLPYSREWGKADHSVSTLSRPERCDRPRTNELRSWLGATLILIHYAHH